MCVWASVNFLCVKAVDCYESKRRIWKRLRCMHICTYNLRKMSSWRRTMSCPLWDRLDGNFLVTSNIRHHRLKMGRWSKLNERDTRLLIMIRTLPHNIDVRIYEPKYIYYFAIRKGNKLWISWVPPCEEKTASFDYFRHWSWSYRNMIHVNWSFPFYFCEEYLLCMFTCVYTYTIW